MAEKSEKLVYGHLSRRSVKNLMKEVRDEAGREIQIPNRAADLLADTAISLIKSCTIEMINRSKRKDKRINLSQIKLEKRRKNLLDRKQKLLVARDIREEVLVNMRPDDPRYLRLRTKNRDSRMEVDNINNRISQIDRKMEQYERNIEDAIKECTKTLADQFADL